MKKTTALQFTIAPSVDTWPGFPGSSYTACTRKEPERRKCAYCGSQVDAPVCPHCGAPE